MLISRRLSLVVAASLTRTSPAFVVPSFPTDTSRLRRTFLAAAPGVEVAPPEEVRKALEDESTVVVDVRGIDEVMQAGVLETDRQWVHAPCSLTEAPLLSVASSALLRDKSATILVYCASGKRAAFTKSFLESEGYEKVLNGGGLADLDYLK